LSVANKGVTAANRSLSVTKKVSFATNQTLVVTHFVLFAVNKVLLVMNKTLVRPGKAWAKRQVFGGVLFHGRHVLEILSVGKVRVQPGPSGSAAL
jgi:hypothetical protein